MPDKTSFISQIQKEEAESAKMLEKVQKENDQRVLKATEEADLMVQKVEEEEREAAGAVIQKAKEAAKEDYNKLLTEANNTRLDLIGSSKKKLSSGKKKVLDSFMAMFE
jgi:vacuolar-type H+-ATPase subunit H